MDLSTLYEMRFPPAESRAMDAVWKVIVEESLSRWIKPEESVVDIGAGACHFINNVRARRRVALDANPNTAKRCGAGVEFVEGQAPDVLGGQRFDVAFISNFLEHLDGPEHVIALLSALRRNLNPGGRLIVLQPNFSLVGPRYFDFIDHKVILNDRSLAEALRLCGFRIAYMKKRFLPYTSKSRLPKAPWLVRLYLRFPPAQYLLGKQSLFVACPAEAP